MFVQAQLWARGVKGDKSENIPSIFHLHKLQLHPQETCVEILECFQLCKPERPQDICLGQTSTKVLFRIWIGFDQRRNSDQGVTEVETADGWQATNPEDRLIIIPRPGPT